MARLCYVQSITTRQYEAVNNSIYVKVLACFNSECEVNPNNQNAWIIGQNDGLIVVILGQNDGLIVAIPKYWLMKTMVNECTWWMVRWIPYLCMRAFMHIEHIHSMGLPSSMIPECWLLSRAYRNSCRNTTIVDHDQSQSNIVKHTFNRNTITDSDWQGTKSFISSTE